MKKERLRLFELLAIFAVAGATCFLIYTKAEAKPSDRDKHKDAIVDCFNGTFMSIGEDHPMRNKVKKNKKLTWHIYGYEDTQVVITFTKKSMDKSCKPISPTDQPGYGTTITNEESPATITTHGMIGDANYDTCYGYKIECKAKDPANSKTIDPIIDVPR